jgi:hypothetical protein
MLITSTRVDIDRPEDGTATDDYGYPVETSTSIATGVRAWVSETSQTTGRISGGDVSRVETWAVQIPVQATAAEIRERDRLTDQVTGRVYAVLSVASSTGLFQQNRIITCTRVS